jgi:hypothetical protein
MLAFYDYPTEHWIHLRTSNPHRVDVLPGEGSHPRHHGPGLTRGGSGQCFKLSRRLHIVSIGKAGAQKDLADMQ